MKPAPEFLQRGPARPILALGTSLPFSCTEASSHELRPDGPDLWPGDRPVSQGDHRRAGDGAARLLAPVHRGWLPRRPTARPGWHADLDHRLAGLRAGAQLCATEDVVDSRPG